jgi:hypothetical protein
MSKRQRIDVQRATQSGLVLGIFASPVAYVIQSFLNAKELFMWSEVSFIWRQRAPNYQTFKQLILQPCPSPDFFAWKGNTLYNAYILRNKALIVIRRLVRENSCVHCGDSYARPKVIAGPPELPRWNPKPRTRGTPWVEVGRKPEYFLCYGCYTDYCRDCGGLDARSNYAAHFECRDRMRDSLIPRLHAQKYRFALW